MSSTRGSRAILGRCPDCRTTIERIDALIEYERGNGDTAIWAECPSCRDVVHPDT